MDIHSHIKRLIDYAVKNSLIDETDRTWAINRVISKLGLGFFKEPAIKSAKLPKYPDEILSDISNYAISAGLIKDMTASRELLETEIMGIFVQRPSDFISSFWRRVSQDGIKAAITWTYEQAKKAYYIKALRIEKNVLWKSRAAGGYLDLAINLSKPEKTPQEIAELKALGARALTDEVYPKCVLCRQNEGFSGRIDVAKQNLRLIPLKLNGESWFFQFSPYVYYDEHCIVLSEKHSDMKIDDKTFVRFADFLEIFPHYFIGSNADLPVVGGSVLNHDHYQGGAFVFPLHKAKAKKAFKLNKFPKLKCFVLDWHMTTIRILGTRQDVLAGASLIFEKWKNFSDESVSIKAKSQKGRHNTVTPLAKKDGKYLQFDLVLRNNAVSGEFPDGIFHTHPEYYHIKRENIGLIEALGLAVLPGRLKAELERVGAFLISGDLEAIYKDPALLKHYEWAKELSSKYKFASDNVTSIIRKEAGRVFENSLKCCSVFKQDEKGLRALDNFIGDLNE